MIDRENVIGNLEMNIRWITDHPVHQFPGWGNAVAAMTDALELLNEQEAVKPEWSNGKAFCGKCGQPFPRHRGNLRRFCSYCGQAVKWE